jgi:hypothetical protein
MSTTFCTERRSYHKIAANGVSTAFCTKPKLEPSGEKAWARTPALLLQRAHERRRHSNGNRLETPPALDYTNWAASRQLRHCREAENASRTLNAAYTRRKMRFAVRCSTMRGKIILFTLVTVLSNGVYAGDIFRCVAADGDVMYTNMACPANSQVQHVASYEPVPDVPARACLKRLPMSISELRGRRQ